MLQQLSLLGEGNNWSHKTTGHVSVTSRGFSFYGHRGHFKGQLICLTSKVVVKLEGQLEQISVALPLNLVIATIKLLAVELEVV